jgi:hypothetical protein
MALTGIVPPTRPTVLTWLHFRFVTDAKDSALIPPSWLRHYETERAKATERFLREMRVQHPDWRFVGQIAEAGGPYPAVRPRGIPKRPGERRPSHPGGGLLPVERADYASYVSDVPSVTETAGWEWELKALFAHPALMTEYLIGDR